ncbi:TetR family transcriptional regulator ActII [Actinomadura vinacea]|uniref:TetR family transcriptional regulator ActII n=1 Tax=Actinomadura vinacea TaxID=115336 RepID=A0ABN3IWQ1_9ACTN
MVADGPEIPAPPWRKQRAGRRRDASRRPLSRELIVDTAIGVLDAEGMDAITMRRIAQELGTGPASLYAHVANKDELLEDVLDRIAAEVALPEPDPARWQEQLKEVAREIRAMYRRHGDIARASLGKIPTSPNVLRIAECELALMRAGGVPPKIAGLAVDRFAQMIDADCIEGTVLAGKSPEGQDPHEFYAAFVPQVRAYFEALPAERFPNIVAMAGELTGGDDDDRFEFGLDIMVRGIASYAEGRPPAG